MLLLTPTTCCRALAVNKFVRTSHCFWHLQKMDAKHIPSGSFTTNVAPHRFVDHNRDNGRPPIERGCISHAHKVVRCWWRWVTRKWDPVDRHLQVGDAQTLLWDKQRELERFKLNNMGTYLNAEYQNENQCYFKKVHCNSWLECWVHVVLYKSLSTWTWSWRKQCVCGGCRM